MVWGALAMLVGVGAGAFGAHALRDVLSPEYASVYETAVRYQLVHGLALLFVALAAKQWPARGWRVVTWLFGAGILLFSGSLYALSLSGVPLWGAVTPIGGVCFLAGWTLVLRAAWIRRVAATGSGSGQTG